MPDVYSEYPNFLKRISVKEKLPKKDGRYAVETQLTTAGFKINNINIVTTEFKEGKFNVSNPYIEVTAWYKPLYIRK